MDFDFENLSTEDKIESIILKLSPEKNDFIRNDVDGNKVSIII